MLVKASKKKLKDILGLGADEAMELAKRLKAVAGDPEEVDQVLDEVSDRLNAFGVESIQGNYQVDRYYYNIVLLYVNRGDTYDDTLLYETDTETFYVGSWGDWVEHEGEEYGVE